MKVECPFMHTFHTYSSIIHATTSLEITLGRARGLTARTGKARGVANCALGSVLDMFNFNFDNYQK